MVTVSVNVASPQVIIDMSYILFLIGYFNELVKPFTAERKPLQSVEEDTKPKSTTSTTSSSSGINLKITVSVKDTHVLVLVVTDGKLTDSLVIQVKIML